MAAPVENRSTLGAACSVRSGFASRGAIPDGHGIGTLTIQQGDLSEVGNYARESALRTSSTAHSPQHYACAGEIIFRSRGPYWSAWEVPGNDEPLLVIAPLFILRPVQDLLDPGYLRWLLMRPTAQQYFNGEAMGTSTKMITKSVLERLPIDLPAIPTQKLLAEAAHLADLERALTLELVELRHRQILSRISHASQTDGINS